MAWTVDGRGYAMGDGGGRPVKSSQRSTGEDRPRSSTSRDAAIMTRMRELGPITERLPYVGGSCEVGAMGGEGLAVAVGDDLSHGRDRTVTHV